MRTWMRALSEYLLQDPWFHSEVQENENSDGGH